MPIPKMSRADLEELLLTSISKKGLFREFSGFEREWLEALKEGTLEIEGYIKYRKLELKRK